MARRGRKSRDEQQITAQPGFFLLISNAKDGNLEKEEEGQVEDEVCVLPGSLISVLGDKMGETEEDVEDFRAVADIYVHILSVIGSRLPPVSCGLVAVASLPLRGPG